MTNNKLRIASSSHIGSAWVGGIPEAIPTFGFGVSKMRRKTTGMFAWLARAAMLAAKMRAQNRTGDQ